MLPAISWAGPDGRRFAGKQISFRNEWTCGRWRVFIKIGLDGNKIASPAILVTESAYRACVKINAITSRNYLGMNGVYIGHIQGIHAQKIAYKALKPIMADGWWVKGPKIGLLGTFRALWRHF